MTTDDYRRIYELVLKISKCTYHSTRTSMMFTADSKEVIASVQKPYEPTYKESSVVEKYWKCKFCGCDESWFDRCLDENGNMNTRCSRCGKADEPSSPCDECDEDCDECTVDTGIRTRSGSLPVEKQSSPCDECNAPDYYPCHTCPHFDEREVPHTREKPAEEQLMICLNARGCDSCCYGTGPHKKTLDCKDHLCSKTGKQISCIPYTPPADTTKKYLDDGFGSRCSITCPDCGQDTMEIVRPGKFQCTNCNNETKETGKDL